MMTGIASVTTKMAHSDANVSDIVDSNTGCIMLSTFLGLTTCIISPVPTLIVLEIILH